MVGLARTVADRIASSLVNRVRRAILGSTGPDELRAALTELAIPANAERRPDAFERIRKAILYDGTSEEELRSALSDLGLSGGGGDPKRGLANIRRAILRNI